jgi:hypothetical protein
MSDKKRFHLGSAIVNINSMSMEQAEIVVSCAERGLKCVSDLKASRRGAWERALALAVHTGCRRLAQR